VTASKRPVRAPNSGRASRGGSKVAAQAGPLPPTTMPVVGLGASAGGLEALEQFFRHVPVDLHMAFVVVQHLDPSHESLLTEILQRNTAMPVVQAEDRMVLQADHVYVIPPNREMVLEGNELCLSLPAEPRGQRMPIDTFLRSLAETLREDAVGIVLSGTGSDGTLGLRAVYGAAGLTLVQEPRTARFAGMPESAIKAGYVSQVLAVEQMPEALRANLRMRELRGAGDTTASGSGLQQILTQLRAVSGHDFSQYKKSTISRRIERRMAQHNIEDAAGYARHLREHPAETQSLFRELLINVTSFFRDPQAFDALKLEILPSLLADRPESSALRIWVTACSTGEEAYSLAILLREVMEQTHCSPKIQFYCTDLDEGAINAARAGRYPASISEDVSPERLRRFFVKEDNGYRVRKEVRDMLVFAVQSVIKDPPFSQIDLLVCRNLLIYLEPELQNRVLATFHYALRPGGILFLSPSESASNQAALFEPLNRKWKLYRALSFLPSNRSSLDGALPWAVSRVRLEHTRPAAPSLTERIAELARRKLLQVFAPAAVVIDLQGDIVYVHGDTGRYLRPAPGLPTHNIVDMAREGLKIALRDVLRQVVREPGLDARIIQAGIEGTPEKILLSVRSMADLEGGAGLLLVGFQAPAAPSPDKSPRAKVTTRGAAGRRVEVLEEELARAEQHLGAMLEAQQAGNEELKSANEELQSTNEELQATNEELETSKEELQSVNEELMTVNAELQSKIDQMASMQDDLKNLLENIRIGTIFLDRQLRIRRFTADASKVYRLAASDVGRPLADIRCELAGSDLLGEAQSVLDNLVPVERELRGVGGSWYLARLQPYRTVDDHIDGVVMTFTDITERMQALAARKARDLAEAIVDAMHEPLLALDGKLRVISANRAYYREFGGQAELTIGRPLLELDEGRWDMPAVRELLESDLRAAARAGRREIILPTAAHGSRRVEVSAHRIAEQAGDDGLILLSIYLLAEA